MDYKTWKAEFDAKIWAMRIERYKNAAKVCAEIEAKYLGQEGVFIAINKEVRGLSSVKN